MKVRSVIVDSLNLSLLDTEVNELTALISKIKEHKRNPIVLLNEHGDELLRKIPDLLDSDLIFSEKSLRKNEGLFVGIHGAGTCAFYIPMGAPYCEESTWSALEKNLAQLPYMNNTHMIIPNEGYPWLITPTGTLYLKSKNSTYELESDEALNKIILDA